MICRLLRGPPQNHSAITTKTQHYFSVCVEERCMVCKRNAQSLPRWQLRNNAPQYATGKADGKGGNSSFGKAFVGFGLEEGCPTL
jgi:hypothetical protein